MEVSCMEVSVWDYAVVLQKPRTTVWEGQLYALSPFYHITLMA